MDGAAITYATSKDWVDIMKNRSKVRMHELIERLGLRAKWSSNKRGKTNFESALLRELVQDMGDIVATLPKESDDLMRRLSEENSLKAEVDALLEKHGTRIWGRVGDREHLITANEPSVEDGLYPRDLYFEDEEDKQLYVSTRPVCRPERDFHEAKLVPVNTHAAYISSYIGG